MPNPISDSIAYRFLPDDAVLDPAAVDDAAYYLGVGGIDHPRVFDHHRPGLPAGTTPASLVWARREALAGAGLETEGITLDVLGEVTAALLTATIRRIPSEVVLMLGHK